ncbi:MAG: TrkA C-terminal domain-containing protein [Oscillospiraceae bacterium]|nr:TrkA C-terminal domain-containing protein [Oscillospiraceae bacterium]
MNIYLAFTLFSLIVLIYWFIAEIFTMLFRFTGIPDEKARFQVISLLTGSGYTTRESELFVSTKARRRLARSIMLFGYVFNVTVISALVNVLFSMKLSQLVSNIVGFLIPILAAVVIILFIRIPRFRSWGERLVEKIVGRIMHSQYDNAVLLLDYIGEDSIAQVTLRKVPEAFAGKPLSETGIRSEYGILVMLVDRGTAEPASADTVFRPGDKLTVFGSFNMICKVFEAKERFDEEN